MSVGAQGREWVSGGTGGRLLAQDSGKNLCDDPFQTVPGSIPGSSISAFTGTRILASHRLTLAVVEAAKMRIKLV